MRTYLTEDEKQTLLDRLRHRFYPAYLYALVNFEYGLRPREGLLVTKFNDHMILKRVLKQKNGNYVAKRKPVKHPDIMKRIRKIEVGDFVVPRNGWTERTCLDYYQQIVREEFDNIGLNETVKFFSIYRHTYLNELARQTSDRKLLAEAVDMENHNHLDFYIEV